MSMICLFLCVTNPLHAAGASFSELRFFFKNPLFSVDLWKINFYLMMSCYRM